jgi:hexosaminidase
MVPINTKVFIQEAARLFIKSILKECGHHLCDLASETDVLVNIIVRSNDTKLNWETEEKFVLNVTSFGGSKVVVQIRAETIYGARHGLETLNQLTTMKPGPDHQ